MIQLKNITKDYLAGEDRVHALKGISLDFRKNEFVSILGPSGCGKTTMLNIIGGLDRYTRGDLLVDGKSTKSFDDNDWDAYRNTTIGFVFQNYNLIPHLTVLDNVQMALSLSGVSAAERRERAVKVLTDVGLSDQIHKKPNQLSGGQMQRVAIARALVNNPKILLADEPTGALDSGTSIQIMDIIKAISKDRLVIMVTHNGDLANQYSDRIIKLLDGKVIEDNHPVEDMLEKEPTGKYINKKTSMSYFTALKTSFNNLLTKKGRTIITALAGSIGIIGIALVLSISSGMTSYVSEMQSDTLAGFPISISETVDTQRDLLERRPGMNQNNADEFPSGDVIYSYDRQGNATRHTNILSQDFLDYLNQMDHSLYNSISYTRNMAMNVIAKNDLGGYLLVPTGGSQNLLFNFENSFNEIPNNPDFILSQYDLLGGSAYPTNYNELVLVVDKQNRVNVNILNAFGINVMETYTFEDFIGKEFKIIPNDVYYINAGNKFVPGTDFEAMYNSDKAMTIKIVGIIRVKPDASSEILANGIGYTTMLTDELLKIENTSAVVDAQKANDQINILTGAAFTAKVTFTDVLRKIGGDSTPSGIQIYPVSFEAKDSIKKYIDEYNLNKPVEDQIIYTDLAEMISTAISSLINTITIILSAFAGISLVVSSIMIGIITYVSVIERTKEIGIMRSIGARKKDISRIFNAETIIIGFTAGLFGILLAVVLTIPINMIISKLIEVKGFARLPIMSGLSLILLSMGLTFIAGLIPSSFAAKKDPVIALRTE
jgi:putative ABC transport system permease protein